MRAPLLASLLALAAPIPGALACGAGTPQPAPLRLPGEGDPEALLFLAAGWETGDAAVVLVGGGAFRRGCEDRLTAAILDSGLAVLALPQPGVAPERLGAAFAVLRDGFGAGSVAVHWPAAGTAMAGGCAGLGAALDRGEGLRRLVCAPGGR